MSEDNYLYTLASFSDDRVYRYSLWRGWEDRGPDYTMFICLNPSTADETEDDPTIRRCVGFARKWGSAAMCMTNLFAFRATDPSVMKAASDPVGPDNTTILLDLAKRASIVVAAWGCHGAYQDRGKIIADLVKDDLRFWGKENKLMCLGKTKHGYPKHPLYLSKNTELMEF